MKVLLIASSKTLQFHNVRISSIKVICSKINQFSSKIGAKRPYIIACLWTFKIKVLWWPLDFWTSPKRLDRKERNGKPLYSFTTDFMKDLVIFCILCYRYFTTGHCNFTTGHFLLNCKLHLEIYVHVPTQYFNAPSKKFLLFCRDKVSLILNTEIERASSSLLTH